MNKLLARVVAVVMAVAMLGTVSFAATTLEGDIITPDVATGEGYTAAYEDQAVKTVLAFQADAATATTPAASADILALEQADEISETIKIDTDKVTKNYVIVLFSGSEGNVVKAVIDNNKTWTGTVTVSKTVTIGEVTYENVALAEYEFVGDGRTVSEYGFQFTQVGGEGEGATLTGEADLTVEGSVTFSAAILAVPVDVTLVATPFITYQ